MAEPRAPSPTIPRADVFVPPKKRDLIILISGKQYAGKDTLAAVFPLLLGERSIQVSFAKEVKRECAAKFGLDYNRLMTDQAYKSEHRQKLIDHGCGRRLEDPDYWVRTAYEQAAKQFDELYPWRMLRIIIISDWRFPNEYKWFNDRQYTVLPVRVFATPDARRSRGWRESTMDADISECSLDDFAESTEMYIVENSRTVEDLYESVKSNWQPVAAIVDRLKTSN